MHSEGLHNWMKDPQQRDQFLIRHQNRTEIFWNDAPEPVCVNDGKEDDLSASLDTVRWTPLGSYLVSFHSTWRRAVRSVWSLPSYGCTRDGF